MMYIRKTFDMLDPDFSRIQLLPSEKLVLLRLQFQKKVPGEHIGKYMEHLVRTGLIAGNATGEQDAYGEPLYDGTYSLTEKSKRYWAYRRDKFFHGSVWPAVLAAIVSLIVTYLRT